MNSERWRNIWVEYQLMDCSAVLILLFLSSLVGFFSEPYCRPFSWDDKTINYPYVTNVTFPLWSLLLLVVLVILFYAVTMIVLGGSAWDWIRTQIFALVMQNTVVSLLKLYAGRPRPDYLSRLQYFGFDKNSHLHESDISEYYCRLGEKYPELREGRLSFPSGHSSTAFALFVLVSIFLVVHTRPLSHEGSFLRLMLCLSPLCIAFFCALSRTRNYWHNFDDVVAGAIIGSVAAFLSFHTTFRITSGGICVSRSPETSGEGEHRGVVENPNPVVVHVS